MTLRTAIAAIAVFAVVAASAAPAKKQVSSASRRAAVAPVQTAHRRSPYVGAICADAATGRVLFTDNAEAEAYPASGTKLMTLFLVLEDVKAEWADVEKNINVQLYPDVSLGWENTLRFRDPRPRKHICTENTPEAVQKGFELAKEYVDSHPDMKAPLVIVNSWNEWTEGSYFEPDDLNGYGYLEACKRVFLE